MVHSSVESRVGEVGAMREYGIVGAMFAALGLLACQGGRETKVNDSTDAAVDASLLDAQFRDSEPDVEMGPDAADPDAGTTLHCDGVTGLVDPQSVCTGEDICLDGVYFSNGRVVHEDISVPSFIPSCRSRDGSMDDGPPLSYADSRGVTRYACIHEPVHSNPLPLILFFHGGGGGADGTYNMTLATEADSFPLSRHAGTVGFVLVSVQGRNLHSVMHRPAPSFDFLYRHQDNPDVEFADHLVDLLVQSGTADASQVYAMGWSMGGYFAQFYVMFHHVTAGGVPLAAASAYGSGNPFADLRHNSGTSCAMAEIPHIESPLYLISAGCDAFSPCSLEQEDAFDPPGNACSPWVELLRSLGARNVTFVVLSSTGQCLPVGDDCTQNIGIRWHLTWPSAQDPDILGFFRDHPSSP